MVDANTGLWTVLLNSRYKMCSISFGETQSNTVWNTSTVVRKPSCMGNSFSRRGHVFLGLRSLSWSLHQTRSTKMSALSNIVFAPRSNFHVFFTNRTCSRHYTRTVKCVEVRLESYSLSEFVSLSRDRLSPFLSNDFVRFTIHSFLSTEEELEWRMWEAGNKQYGTLGLIDEGDDLHVTLLSVPPWWSDPTQTPV